MFLHLFSSLYLAIIVIPSAIFAIAFLSYGLSKEDKDEIKAIKQEKPPALSQQETPTEKAPAT